MGPHLATIRRIAPRSTTGRRPDGDARRRVHKERVRETRTKALVGKVAIEFSLENYGPGEWWLLLEPSPAAGGS